MKNANQRTKITYKEILEALIPQYKDCTDLMTLCDSEGICLLQYIFKGIGKSRYEMAEDLLELIKEKVEK